MADPSLDIIPRTIGGWAGWAGFFGFGLNTAWHQWRKSKVDETATATATWKALLDQYTADVKELRDELRFERAASSDLRKRLGDTETLVSEQRIEIGELRARIDGLTRQLLQMGRSSVMLLANSDVRDDPAITRAIERIEGNEPT